MVFLLKQDRKAFFKDGLSINSAHKDGGVIILEWSDEGKAVEVCNTQ